MKYTLLILSVCLSIRLRAQTLLASTELEAESISQVKITGSFCDVYIEKGNRNYLKGSIVGKGDEGDFEFDTSIDGATLVVRVIRNDRRAWRGYNLRESKLELTVLEGVAVDVDNTSGDVYISGLDASESRVEATSGDISLSDIDADLTIKTTSGDIALKHIIGNLAVKSTSGDQRITRLEGSLNTIATSGDIQVEDFEGDVDIEATSGDVQISDGAGGLRIKTTAGNIRGGAIKINQNSSLRASSGDISINFTNELDEMSFDLTATSGDLKVDNKSGEKKLYIDRGGVKITGVTTSGDQSYY